MTEGTGVHETQMQHERIRNIFGRLGRRTAAFSQRDLVVAFPEFSSDDAVLHFSPSWRGTSTHARLATRASWARFSTSATVRIRFARARGLPSVGTRSARRSPETLYNFPRRRPPPPNRATDGPRTRDADPLPRVSLTHSAAAKVYVGTEVAIGLGLGLIAGAAWKVRLDAAPDVRVPPLFPRQSVTRAPSEKYREARAGAPVHRLAPRRTPPDPPRPRALARRTGTGPTASKSRTTTRATDPAAIGRRRRRRRFSCTLSQTSRGPTKGPRRDTAPRLVALEITTSRVYSTHIACRSPRTNDGDARLFLYRSRLESRHPSTRRRRLPSFSSPFAPPSPSPHTHPLLYSLKSFLISSGAALTSVTGHVPLLRTCATAHE